MGATLPAVSRWVETTPEGIVAAGVVLRRQHRGRRVRFAARRLLPAARLRHAHRHLRRRRAQRSGRDGCAEAGARHAPRSTQSSRSPQSETLLRFAVSAFIAVVVARPINRVPRDRAVRVLRARRRSDLDASARAALRRDRLHVLAHPRGVSDRARDRQQPRLGAVEAGQSASGLRLVPDGSWLPPSRGRRTSSRCRCRTGRSIPPSRVDIWLNFRLDFLRAMWVVLPPAALWGASFPLALASVAEPGQDPGRLVGGVYAANTIGAVAGALIGEPAAHRVDRIAARAAGDDGPVGARGSAAPRSG